MCSKKEYALYMVINNWRIRQRLPRITKLAIELGYIKNKDDGKDI